MTKKKIKLFVAAVYSIIFVTLFAASQIWTSAQIKEKTVEETRKNIQVLKGLPDSQLFITMNFIRGSLGVSCAYCHVNSGGDKWEWEKDDRAAKITARKHIQMTFDINKASFGGRTVVTCNTCHQGQTKPSAVPVLPQAQPVGGPAGVIPVAVLPAVDELLDKYVQALGGAAAIQKLKTKVMKGSHITSDGTVLPLEIYQSAPNKFVSMVTLPNGVASRAFNGTTGWIKNPRGQRELAGPELAEMKRSAEFYDALKLKELYPNLKVIGREKIGEREAFVVESSGAEKTVRLFFDAQNGLLLRVMTLTQTLIANIPEQLDFEDYREIDGVKVPFTIRQSFVDPWIGWTRKFTEIKHNLVIDESKFAMPAAENK